MHNQDPKAAVLQEIMALMDDQMVSKFRKPAKQEEELPGEEMSEVVEGAPAEESPGIDAETLRKLMEMNDE